MDFRFTQDQQDLIDAAKAVFDGENTVERMRAMVAGEQVEDLWPKFAELGLLGVMAPEESGGLGQPLVVMVGIAETAGYAGLPEPLVEVAGISMPINGNEEFILNDLRPFIAGRQTHQSIDPLRSLQAKAGAVNPQAELHGAVLTAAQLVGLSQRMVDMSVDSNINWPMFIPKSSLRGPWYIWRRSKAAGRFIRPKLRPSTQLCWQPRPLFKSTAAWAIHSRLTSIYL